MTYERIEVEDRSILGLIGVARNRSVDAEVHLKKTEAVQHLDCWVSQCKNIGSYNTQAELGNQ